ncbi:MAG: hypothetical protein F6J94_17665 [Moorea sp. SIO1F2]|nr:MULTISPECIES: hypothetical protein [unclassified Moorena]NEO21647.1 hypothetical protein [Moorena sp. SIO4A5]NEO65513.1 hypothetical protein [Moorena sp. SIO4G2]NEQ56187.1 hypothetical protein [Moorena sp. SIO4A1]NET83678.1 hypothetical protein [Moorena sp. SIO1F2]
MEWASCPFRPWVAPVEWASCPFRPWVAPVEWASCPFVTVGPNLIT